MPLIPSTRAVFHPSLSFPNASHSAQIIVFKYVLYGTYIASSVAHSRICRDSDFGSPGLLEEYIVRNLNRYISSLVLASALAAPVVIMAAPAPQEASVQVRVYDRNHKDYHNWDDREDRAYRGYLTEQHRNYREYNKQNSRQQRNYWAWRHSHPDRD